MTTLIDNDGIGEYDDKRDDVKKLKDERLLSEYWVGSSNYALYADYIAFCKSIGEFSSLGAPGCKLTKTKFSEDLLKQMPDFFNESRIPHLYKTDHLRTLLGDPSFVKDLVDYANKKDSKNLPSTNYELYPTRKVADKYVEPKYEDELLEAATFLICCNLQYSMQREGALRLMKKENIDRLQETLKTGIKKINENGILDLNEVNITITPDTSDKDSMKPPQLNMHDKPSQYDFKKYMVKNKKDDEAQKKYTTEFNDYLNDSNSIDLSRPLITKDQQSLQSINLSQVSKGDFSNSSIDLSGSFSEKSQRSLQSINLTDDDCWRFSEVSKIDIKKMTIYKSGSHIKVKDDDQSFPLLKELNINFKVKDGYLYVKKEAIKKTIKKKIENIII